MRKLISQRAARRPHVVAVVVCLLFAALCVSAEARGWSRVRSEHFVVVSNAGEAEARRSASRLEELRAIFARLQGRDALDVSIPVTVILFQNAGDYEFFKPTYGGDLRRDVAGYFQFSPEINYITLSLDVGARRDPHSVLFHEYVHALVKNNYAGAPVWFNEGLAQYYSEFELSKDRRRVSLGRQLTHRLDSLARGELLPLKTLLSADESSAHYQQHDKHPVFYAQSWAFVHYLLNDPTGARRSQLARYLELVSAGTTVEESFREAFNSDFARMEGELRAYVRAAHYRERSENFIEPVPSDVKLETRALTEAESQAALGDLLLRTNRPDDAEEYLTRALHLDARLAAAHASLGLLRLKQNRLDAAKEHLERALAADPQNHLAHFYYADLLRREGLETEKTIAGYAATTERIRFALKRVIELAPDFLEAHALLALVDVERSPRLDETFALLGRAAALAPKRQEFKLILAQLHLRREEFERAREILAPLARDPRSALTRAEALSLLEKVRTSEELAAAQRKAKSFAPDETADAAKAAAGTQTAPTQEEGVATTQPVAPETLPCDMPQPGPQYKPLRFDGQQACGQLVSVECEDAGGVTLLVETSDGTLKLRSRALNRIRFVSYTADVRGRIECGLRTRANPVLVTYRSTKDAHATADGEVLAVEFVPPDWVH
ncbi:MAG TPA: tetratricopeptide repeat protein [Pyrinomonadaceae bacterium]|nr:tetratricopeptide repeat protein [Pyrinomonadaceae bacterium]